MLKETKFLQSMIFSLFIGMVLKM